MKSNQKNSQGLVKILEMLCFLIVSARTLVDEPKVYGSMRLVEAAERLLSLVDELGLHDEFLTEVRERLKLCPLENLPGEEGEFIKFLDELILFLAEQADRVNVD